MYNDSLRAAFLDIFYIFLSLIPFTLFVEYTSLFMLQ